MKKLVQFSPVILMACLFFYIIIKQPDWSKAGFWIVGICLAAMLIYGFSGRIFKKRK
jgi:hypothetical protein